MTERLKNQKTFEEMKDDIVKFIRRECSIHDVTAYFGKGKSVQCGSIKTNGYFSSSDKKLAVSLGKDDWVFTLVHEYSHMKQWLENCKEWSRYVATDHQDYGRAFTNSNNINSKNLRKSIEVIMNLELDCEQRSVKLLREFGFNEDLISEYTQKANSYIIFYLFIEENRTWYEIGREPYSLEKVWKKFPKNFNYDRIEIYGKNKDLFHQCVPRKGNK